ncbi:MAG: hypothetical protein QM758_09745 [Armatimonas sp.]
MKIRSIILGVVASLSVFLLMGCHKEEAPTNPEVGKTPVGAAPTNSNDALNNPHVPDSVKSQIKGMQNQGGGGRRP